MKSILRYIGIVIIALGVILLVIVYPHWNSAFWVPFQMNANEFPNKNFLRERTAVDADLTMIMDGFASETVRGTVRKKLLGTSRYEFNIVPVFVGNETYYVGIRLSEEQFAQAENIIESTKQYHYGEAVAFEERFEVTGTFVPLDEELYAYMKEWFLEMGWLSDEEINKYVLPLVIEPVEPAKVKSGAYLAIGLIMTGVIGSIVSFFIDVKYLRRVKVLRKCTGVIESERCGRPITIPVRELDDVDKAMWKGKKDKARNILIKSYKATEQEADDIVNRWLELTSPEEMK